MKMKIVRIALVAAALGIPVAAWAAGLGAAVGCPFGCPFCP
jgi:hypothetical protein